ncbi:MAG TPA: anion transporter [Dehalococcoidia bacterium]|nr:anion transporter [Dehalococcoidia bacterium]
MISIITLAIVFVLIAVRKIGNIRFQIWQIMLLGAITVLVTLQITPLAAIKSIDIDVMLFLFGVFIIGRALEESGYLSSASFRLFSKAKSPDILLLTVIFSMGLLSAFLMNDTMAIIGTPVVLLLSRRTGMQTKILLLALAFSVTTGSVMSPVGNPQNLLIAIHGDISNPFVTFFRFLFIPTILNLFATYLLLRLYFRKHFNIIPVISSSEPGIDHKLARYAKISLALFLILILIKIITVFAGIKIDFRLTYIALISALPIVLLSRRRIEMIRNIDWSTLVFFAAMFVLMASVWNTGIFQEILESMNLDITSNGTIIGISILLSQLISNVPMVALYLPVVIGMGGSTSSLMALAAGSTIAGNLTILGAASNVIIIQNAETSGGVTVTFWEFLKIGLPLTVVNSAVYWLFLSI